jgi:hypothetical protein
MDIDASMVWDFLQQRGVPARCPKCDAAWTQTDCAILRGQKAKDAFGEQLARVTCQNCAAIVFFSSDVINPPPSDSR